MTAPDRRELYAGMMSGTSLDGIDVAIVDFAEERPQPVFCLTTAYDDSLRRTLRRLCSGEPCDLEILYRCDAQLGDAYAAALEAALQQAGLAPPDIRAVGCHGQTLWHSPDSTPAFTVQIGDPNRVAATGIITVADFRRKDVANGGQGAPLAPLLHRALLRDSDEDRVIVNIGGIANITALPANPAAAVRACDTGPGNSLMDAWIERHRQLRFDEAGQWARGGSAIDGLLVALLQHEPYFTAPQPKTTGTETFNLAWLEPRLSPDYDPRDVQATLLELTARTIAAEIDRLPLIAPACYVCGGGARNPYLLQRLGAALPDSRIDTTATLGLDPDYVEATAFAWFARERLAGRPLALTDITRARRDGVLGAIYAPDPAVAEK